MNLLNVFKNMHPSCPLWAAAIANQTFFIVAEETSIGQYVMGHHTTGSDDELLVPSILADEETAVAERANERDDWLEMQDGEASEEDCPIFIYMMKWDGSDVVSIYTADGKVLLDDTHTWKWHCGIE